MESFEKYIYNTWLKHTRRGQPWQARKDFDGFEESQNYVPLMKLVSFFKAHSNVNVDRFIKAPYEVYGADKTYYLDFYITQRAVTAYTLYNDKVINESPDLQLEAIVDSFNFIKQFCCEKQLQLTEYLSYRPGAVNEFLVHLLQHNVTVYALFAFPEFDKRMSDTTVEERKFLLGERFIDNIDTFRTRWYTSSKAKILSNSCYNKVKKIVEKLDKRD